MNGFAWKVAELAKTGPAEKLAAQLFEHLHLIDQPSVSGEPDDDSPL
jgi:hypothetical protein